MIKVRLFKKKYNLRNRRFLMIMIALSIIILGVALTSSHILKYARGYFVYRTAYQSIPLEENNKAVVPASTLKLSKQEKKTVLYSQRPGIGDSFGELFIPKLKATLPIFEGTSEEELEKGVGHFAGSVLPGEKDNSVLSGHRDTVFRKLGEVGEGDLLIVKTAAGEFTYKVSKVRIVDKDDRTVIVPKPNATLTVSTCYPFHYIGAAPKRYVLVAYLSSKIVY